MLKRYDALSWEQSSKMNFFLLFFSSQVTGDCRIVLIILCYFKGAGVRIMTFIEGVDLSTWFKNS